MDAELTRWEQMVLHWRCCREYLRRAGVELWRCVKPIFTRD